MFFCHCDEGEISLAAIFIGFIFLVNYKEDYSILLLFTSIITFYHCQCHFDCHGY